MSRFEFLSMRNALQVLKIAGAYLATLIGSGFATGQEVLQYFAGFGLLGIGGCLIFLVGAIYFATSLLLAGQRNGLRNSDEVFRYYAGPVIGPLFGWYVVLVVYSVYVVMLSGAGAVVHQYFGTPVQLGATAMAIAVFLTVYLGLHKLVDIIGSIGPVLVVLILVIAVAAVFGDASDVRAGNDAAPTMNLLRAAPNWWMAGIVYTAMCYSALPAFLAPLGADTASRSVLVAAGVLGPLLYSAALVLCTVALLGAMPGVETKLIPMLEIAGQATPQLAAVFSWIVLACIFTTAAPMLWIAVARLAPDGSPRYRLLTALLAGGGYVLGLVLPFDRLLNLVYPTIGWSGILVLLFIVAQQVRTRRFG